MTVWLVNGCMHGVYTGITTMVVYTLCHHMDGNQHMYHKEALQQNQQLFLWLQVIALVKLIDSQNHRELYAQVSLFPTMGPDTG